MNINSIKAFSWLISAGLTAGVGYYAWDFQQNRAELLGFRISKADTRKILNSALIPEGPVSQLVEIGAIERGFYFDAKNPALPNLLDWTGARPRKAVAVTPTEDVVVKAPRKQLKDSLSILMVREDTFNPERSQAWIQYKPASNVKVKPDGFLSRVTVGDYLAAPLDDVLIKSIEALSGITFSFAEEDREDELLVYGKFDSGVKIRVVDSDNPLLIAEREELPTLDSAFYRPEHTVLLGTDSFMLGTEEMKDFSEDFGGILAREVRHGRHYNSKTREYDGIELKEVKAGGHVAAHGGQSGDIIKSVNGHPVTSASEAISFVKNNQDKYSKWLVVVENKGKERTMTFTSPPSED
jgi:hypothetical protein